jgi:hypothetical protein
MRKVRSAASSAPKKEKSAGARRMMEDVREFGKLTTLHRGLVPLSAAATILGISRQRVHQLAKEGTFSHWTFYRMKWLSYLEILSFATINRMQGENQYRPSTKQIWRDEFIGTGKVLLKTG